MTLVRLGLCVILASLAGTVASTETDLDAFMREVVARRDDNWKKLQQYILDERERVELQGPAHVPLWGEQREYTWYIREGFFVRSPLKVNGATVSESDRLKYEADFLKNEKAREERAKEKPQDPGQTPPARQAGDEAPRDLDSLIKQTRQPQFISSAYFLRFKFDAGRYALVGRERLEDRDVLRIEYYPTNLFDEDQQERDERNEERNHKPVTEKDARTDRLLSSLMNKTSKVTLWIDPATHQILKYTFDDLNWNFFPGQWLVRVSNATASMTMGQAFPDVWLPRALEMDVTMTLAIGPVNLHYNLDYHDYRQPEVTSTIGVPGRR